MDEIKRPLTIAQTVALQIREKILNREIAGGEHLRQDAIAKSFGISIIPVREALRQLELEGLVELKTHRGAVATELTVDKALEWIRMRSLIETDLIGLAMEKMSDSDVVKAGAVLEKFDLALERRIQIDQWSDFNWQFHAALYAPAARPETMKVLLSLHKNCDRYIRLQLLSSDHISRAHKEHHELLEVWSRRRKRAAKMLLTEHLSGVAQDLSKVLKA